MPASVRLHGRHVGTLDATSNGLLSFRYDADWLASGVRHGSKYGGLSLAMPPEETPFGHESAGPFFAGLLPDSTIVRDRLAAHLGIDGSNDFALLQALGSECQGAVTVHDLSDDVRHDSEVVPDFRILSEIELAARLRDLPQRPLFIDADAGPRLTLAGMQPKAALLCVGRDLALSTGRTPTTHMVKTDIVGLKDSIKVENFCLEVARRVGLDTITATLRSAEDIPYLLIVRFDRTIGTIGNRQFVRRIHQQDFCQALGRFPRQKYERDGGPGWRECFHLMEQTADQAASRWELLRRAIFQFLIGNPDAHAKNYALIHRTDGIHLGKFYDLNNAAAFRSMFKEQRPRLAMSVGGERNPACLDQGHWIAFAKNLGFEEDLVLRNLASTAVSVQSAAPERRRREPSRIRRSLMWLRRMYVLAASIGRYERSVYLQTISDEGGHL